LPLIENVNLRCFLSMKLLFDQNLSRWLPTLLADIYPDSIHVSDIGLSQSPDLKVWTFARDNGFALVSKDSDFQQWSLLFGAPPKFVWLRVGNCKRSVIEDLLRKHSVTIHTFELDNGQSHLMLP
jgi:predicted nuclease of predicted toxin-antitoxin system